MEAFDRAGSLPELAAGIEDLDGSRLSLSKLLFGPERPP